MDTQRFVVGPLSALCILALVMGTASAAVMTAGGTSNPDTGPVHHHLSPEDLINSLEEQGVDITEVKTLLQNGDTDAVKAWLENYFQSNKPTMPDGSARSPPDLTDPTRQEKIITRLEEKGVDVTEAEAELESGDTSAVKVWLDNYFHAHEGEMPFHHPCGEPPTEIPSGTSSQSNQ
jgi:hypothetical protein